jgi:hypothetical protein
LITLDKVNVRRSVGIVFKIQSMTAYLRQNSLDTWRHFFAVYINTYKTDFNTEYLECTGNIIEVVEAAGVQKLQRVYSIRHSIHKELSCHKMHLHFLTNEHIGLLVVYLYVYLKCRKKLISERRVH